MGKKPTVVQKTYCTGKKTAMRGLEVSNGEMSHLHYDHCNGVQYRFFGKTRIARKLVEWGFLGSWPLACT